MNCLLIKTKDVNLSGHLTNPAKISVVVVGDADVSEYYNLMKATVAALSGNKIILDIEIRHVPDTIFELQEVLDPWYLFQYKYFVPLEVEKELFKSVPGDKVIRQMIYDVTGYIEQPIYSCAHLEGQGNVQYSQVILPDSALNVVALHEACHGWCSYFGIEDRVHEFLKDSNKSFPALIDYLIPHFKEDLPLLFYIPNPKK